jgi:hypothetical protein
MASLRGISMRRLTTLVCCVALLLGVHSSPAHATCAGDCGGTQAVFVSDIITLANIALGNAQPSACPNGIPNGAEVNVALIIQAVNNAPTSCPTVPPGLVGTYGGTFGLDEGPDAGGTGEITFVVNNGGTATGSLVRGTPLAITGTVDSSGDFNLSGTDLAGTRTSIHGQLKLTTAAVDVSASRTSVLGASDDTFVLGTIESSNGNAGTVWLKRVHYCHFFPGRWDGLWTGASHTTAGPDPGPVDEPVTQAIMEVACEGIIDLFAIHNDGTVTILHGEVDESGLIGTLVFDGGTVIISGPLGTTQPFQSSDGYRGTLKLTRVGAL